MATSQIDQLLQQYAGKEVPYSFHAGYVSLSYVVSLVGAASTLELIRRRTSHKGIHNLFLLAGAAICMGGIAIWSMHFVGNRAVSVLGGQEVLQIAYSTNLTILSLSMPILVLLLAFVLLNASTRVSWWRLALSGTLSGSAICGMHYLADMSIRNYDASYKIPYVVGAALIAVVASSAAFALFFIFEAAWSNVWWRRAGCAMVLAGAVSGMHWCAAVGTSYRLKSMDTLMDPQHGHGVSRQDAFLIVTALSISACVIITCSAIFSTWVRRVSAQRAQKVVLASAVFDDRGRIMVSNEGLLPSQVVTNTFVPRTNAEFFDTSHPIFHWMFRASRCWSSIESLIGSMTRHMDGLSEAKVKLIADDGTIVDNYDTIICELFCLAASGLASQMRESLSDMGVLYDEIFTTGDDGNMTATKLRKNRPKSPFSLHSQSGTVELDDMAEKGSIQDSLFEYGRGSLMFLVRQVSSHQEIERLKAAGYRFAQVHQVLGNIQSGMQILTRDLDVRMHSMKIAASRSKQETAMLKPGVHVGAFIVKARLEKYNNGGFDIVCQNRAKNRIPTVQLNMDQIMEAPHHECIAQMHGLTTSAVIQRLQAAIKDSTVSDTAFAKAFLNAIVQLRDWFSEDLDSNILDRATLMPRAIEVPCNGGGSGLGDDNPFKGPNTCTLISFGLVLPIYARDRFKRCTFDSLEFFKTRQLVYVDSPHIAEFAHQVHRQLLAVALQRSPLKTTRKSLGPFSKNIVDRSRNLLSLCKLKRMNQSLSTNNHKGVSHENILSKTVEVIGSRKDEVEDCRVSHEQSPPPQQSRQFYGGIMVSQQIVIDVKEKTVEDGVASDGATTMTLPIRNPTQPTGPADSSYTAVVRASSEHRNLSQEQIQASTMFVDRLLQLCMEDSVRFRT